MCQMDLANGDGADGMKKPGHRCPGTDRRTWIAICLSKIIGNDVSYDSPLTGFVRSSFSLARYVSGRYRIIKIKAPTQQIN